MALPSSRVLSCPLPKVAHALLILSLLLILILAPSTASAAEGAPDVVTWVVVGTVAVQFLLGLVSGVVVVVVRERVATEAARMTALEQRLQDTREQYATREQLKETTFAIATLRREVLEDVRNEMELRLAPVTAQVTALDDKVTALDAGVTKLTSEVASMRAVSQRILDLLDPPGPGKSR